MEYRISCITDKVVCSVYKRSNRAYKIASNLSNTSYDFASALCKTSYMLNLVSSSIEDIGTVLNGISYLADSSEGLTNSIGCTTNTIIDLGDIIKSIFKTTLNIFSCIVEVYSSIPSSICSASNGVDTGENRAKRRGSRSSDSSHCNCSH